MRFLWRLDHSSLFMPTCSRLAGGLLAVSLLTFPTGSKAEQGQRVPPPSEPVPTLQSFPNVPLPAGHLQGWCGNKAVVWGAGGLVISDGATNSPPISFSSNSKVYCSDDGQRLLRLDDNVGWPEKTGSILELDVASGAVKRTLATYQKQSRPIPSSREIVSFSPDLKHVATTETLTLPPSSIALNVISLRIAKGQLMRRVNWSRDSSRFSIESASKNEISRAVVEIFDTQYQKTASGPIPAGFYLKNVWFGDSNTIYLFVASIENEFGPGVVLRCQTKGWKCTPAVKGVLKASVGGDGILGVIRPIGKYSYDGDSTTHPPFFLVEIRDRESRVVARQSFKSDVWDGLDLKIAPSGTKVVLNWLLTGEQACPPKKQIDGNCHEGMMVDLSGKPK